MKDTQGIIFTMNGDQIRSTQLTLGENEKEEEIVDTLLEEWIKRSSE